MPGNAAPGKRLQGLKVIPDECFLLGAGPAFELSLPPSGRNGVRMLLGIGYRNWRVKRCLARTLSVQMLDETIPEIVTSSDVERSRSKTQDVDARSQLSRRAKIRTPKPSMDNYPLGIEIPRRFADMFCRLLRQGPSTPPSSAAPLRSALLAPLDRR